MENIREFRTRTPWDNKLIKAYPFLTNEQIKQRIDIAYNGFLINKKRPIEEKLAFCKKAAEILETRKEEIAKVITEEVGKPLEQSRYEVDDTIKHFLYYFKNGAKMVEKKPLVNDKKAYVRYDPVGIIFDINPWNFPFYLPLFSGLPPMLLGNSILFKPSPTTPKCGMLAEEIMKQCGFNHGEYQTIFLDINQTEVILADPRVAGSSLTGSAGAGKAHAALAAKYLKYCRLELGGSDPFIVLADADIQKSAENGCLGRLYNAGQVCCASKRFIIHESVYEPFIAALIKEIEKMPVGNPLDPATKIGPLIRKDLQETLKKQAHTTIANGAKVRYGDVTQLTKPQKNEEGNYFTPMILDNIPKGSPGAEEELFGPVFCLWKFKNEDEAVEIANSSIYGLSGMVMGKNVEKAEEVAAKLIVGTVGINELVPFDSGLPFGGTKNSGYGREGGEEAVTEFSTKKTVYIGQTKNLGGNL